MQKMRVSVTFGRRETLVPMKMTPVDQNQNLPDSGRRLRSAAPFFRMGRLGLGGPEPKPGIVAYGRNGQRWVPVLRGLRVWWMMRE